MCYLCIYIRVAFRATHIFSYTQTYSHVGIIVEAKQDAYGLYTPVELEVESFCVIEEHDVHHRLHLPLSSCR